MVRERVGGDIIVSVQEERERESIAQRSQRPQWVRRLERNGRGDTMAPVQEEREQESITQRSRT
jgi:hypothetical protein